jgi:LysM repeat protein
VERDEWRRYAAPAGFLLLVTVAVILIHAGLEGGGGSNVQPPVPPPPTTTRVRTTGTTTAETRTARSPARRYWTVRAGDTFGVISRATGVPLATIERLNPGLSSTSLTIGEKVRVR